MLRCFKSGQKKEEDDDETSSPFLENGSALLKELISTFNGRQEIPIHCYTTEEIITATNNFADRIGINLFLGGVLYRGFMNERQILVKVCQNEESEYPPLSPRCPISGDRYIAITSSCPTIRDIAITSQMSILKNVLKLSGCCLVFKHPVLVYEYVEFEILEHIMHFLPWRNRIKIALDIASTVLYFHTSFQTPIIYRNLTPSNVIIDQNGVAKLFDFSFSISLPQGESQVEDEFIIGAIGFTDPKYCKSRFVTQKSDVYSFGVILLELVAGLKFRQMNFEPNTIHIFEYVEDHIEKDQLSQVIDPQIVNQGFDQQQLQAVLNLGMLCAQERGKDRPEMIDVARELRQIVCQSLTLFAKQKKL